MKRKILLLLILFNSVLIFGQITPLSFNGGTLSNPSSYVEYNGGLYFAAVNPATGNRAMFSMDASENIQLEWGSSGNDVREVTVFQNEIYLTFSSGAAGPILLQYQGNGGGSVQVAEISIFGEMVVFSDATFGQRLYFSGENQSSTATGPELYAYDGTSAALIADQIPGADGLAPNQFEIHESQLYFTGFVDSGNYGIYTTNGNTVQLITSGFDINEIPKESFNDQLYYVNISTNELLSYDAASSVETNVSNGLIDVAAIFNLEKIDNKLVLGAKSPSATIYQPALLNTSGNLEPISFENSANVENYIYTIGVFGNRAFIRGSSDTFGSEIYEYVVGENNTKLVQDYNQGTDNSTAGGEGIIEFNGNIYMDARSSNTGNQELVAYKKTACQTTASLADTNFEAYLEDPTNTFLDALGNQVFPSDGISGNNTVCLDAIERIDELNIDETVVNADIVSYLGIQNFKALTKFSLRASPAGLISLELDLNANLIEIDISDTNIENLILPTNTNTLQKIALSRNNLNGIVDVSGNSALTEIQAIQSTFSSLNTTDCTALKILNFDNGSVESLDLLTNNNLESLTLDANPITDLELDSGNYPNLTSIIVTRSDIENLTIRNTAIASINLNDMDQLELVIIEENNLLRNVSLNDPSTKPISTTLLSLRANNLTGDLDISDLINITEIDVSGNPNLTTLDVTDQINLEDLATFGSGITQIDLSTNSGTLLEVTVGTPAGDSNLISLNLNNTGNNLVYRNFILNTDRNPALNCIEVHSIFEAKETVSQGFWSVPSNQTFSTNCLAPEVTTTVPDDVFEEELERLGYGDGIANNDLVLTASIEAVQELDLTNLFINDLAGIERFASLEVLNISGTNTTEFDLTANPTLVELNANLTSMITLNTATIQNSTLRRLSLSGNSLSTIELSKYIGLEYLNISENGGITELVLTDHPSLSTLLLEGSGIVDIELSQTALTAVDLNRVLQIRSAQIYDNVNLTSVILSAAENPSLVALDFRNNDLQSLDLRGLIEITVIDVSGNLNLSELDIRSQTNLGTLSTYQSGLTTVDLSTNDGNLSVLEVGSPNGNSNLKSLNLNNRNLDYTAITLIADNNFDLKCMEVYDVAAADDAVSQNLNTWSFLNTPVTFSTDCSAAQGTTRIPDPNFRAELMRLGHDDDDPTNEFVLTSSIAAVTNLVIPGLGINDLTGIEAFTSLVSLEAEANGFTTIDVSNLNNLEVLRLGSNGLNAIDLNSNTKLRVFEAANNNLQNIDFSNNPELEDVYLFDNALRFLNVSTNLKLDFLTANGNPLECVQVDDVVKAQNLFDSGDWLTESRDVFSENCNPVTSFEAEVSVVTDIPNTLNTNEGLRNVEIQMFVPNADTENLIVEFDVEVIGVTAIAGSDFTAVPQNEKLTYEYFNDGLTIYDISILDDGSLESDEQFRIRISNPSDTRVSLKDADMNGNLEFLVTILDNEVANAVLSATDGSEGGNARFTVSLQDGNGNPVVNNTGGDITFGFTLANGLAVAPDDFAIPPANTVLSVGDGAVGGFFDVALIDDTDQEPQEDFTATISAPNLDSVTISQGSATATIAASDSVAATNDNDGDGILNDIDNCIGNPNADQADFDGDGIGDVCDTDEDNDGVLDIDDACSTTPQGVVVGVGGCPLPAKPDIGPEDIRAQVQNATCPGVSNGIIAIELFKDYKGTVTVSGPGLSEPITTSLSMTLASSVEGLASGVYNVCVTLAEIPDFEQCYNLNVLTYEDLVVAVQGVDSSAKSATFEVRGSKSYEISVSGKAYHHEFDTTESRIISVPLKSGVNKVHISGSSDCQGVFTDEIVIGHITAFPNPVVDELYFEGILGSGNANILITDLSGKIVRRARVAVSNGKASVDFTLLGKGVYVIFLITDQEDIKFKILKK